MNLQLVGCSHHQSNVSIREQLAFSENQIRPFLQSFYESFPHSEAVLLSTCNRTELYVAGREPNNLPSQDVLIDLWAENRGFSRHDIRGDLFAHEGQQAVQHLFSVAASLDSMVLGEAQILSQVKQAYQMACETNQEIPLSHQIFQTAIRVARRVANETKIHANRVSIPSIAVGSFARQIFERFDNKRILIIGAGEMASETLTYLQENGGQDVAVVNRTKERAAELAAKFNGQVFDWQQLENELVKADIIVSTTGATQPVVTTELFDRVVAKRQQRPVFILDLAIPRDFEPAIGERLNVYLYSIDDLERECERNRKARKSEWPKAQKIIDKETQLFMQQMKHRSGGAAIAQLKQQANEIRDSELQRLMNRLDGVSDEHRKEIDYAFSRLVNKILHPPLESLKEESSEGSSGLLDAMKRLFRLGE